MSGSAIADAAGTGKMMQHMMTKDGKYPPSFAAALTAASAVIGPIIPPSIPMILYALVSDASIGYLFLAGVVPGLLMGASQRSEEHTSELQSLMRISYAVFCLKKKKTDQQIKNQI